MYDDGSDGGNDGRPHLCLVQQIVEASTHDCIFSFAI